MSIAAESRVLLRGVHWETYERLVADRGDHGPRLTFARGVLEIMSPSRTHERHKKRLARAVETMAEILGVPIQCGGSMGFRSELLEQGFEPDECWWIQRAALVREEREFDPAVDPPPDLVLEVEVSRGALDKLAIFAAFGVGEVWRYDGERLRVYVRDETGAFREQPASRCFPWLPIAELQTQLVAAAGADVSAWLRSFRAWVHARLLPVR